jgi:hypothetical protein
MSASSLAPFLAAIWALLSDAVPPPSPGPFEAEMARALREVERDEWNELPHPIEPAGALLMARLWDLGARWTASYLDGSPEASAEELCAAFHGIPELHPTLGMSAVRLAAGAEAAFAVTLSGNRTGTVFVVARGPSDRFEPVWSIKELAARHYEQRDQLGYWAYMGGAWGDGPLSGEVHPLPAGGSGRPRFYLAAHANPEAGGTYPEQLSVWEWDGLVPRCLFIDSYAVSIGGAFPLALEGDRIRIHAKGELKTTFSCGMCPDPVVIRTLRLGPDGVEDLGSVFQVPELEAADELVDRLMHGRDSSDLATPEAARALAGALGLEPGQAGPEQDRGYSLGMLSDWRVEPAGAGTVLKLSTDELGCTELRFERRQGRLFVTGAAEIEDGSGPCSDPGP